MLKLKDSYICALDIGSNKIAAVLVRMHRGKIAEWSFETVGSRGIERGSVVDAVALVSSISTVLKLLRAKSKVNFKYVYANISGQDVATKHSHAIIPLTERGNKVITASDVRKVNEQASVLGSSLEEEIVHRIPYSYTIDSKADIFNPLGLYSHRLEVDLLLVCVKLSTVQALERAINQAGFELKDLYLSGIATAEAVFSKDLKEGTNVLCDVGADTTELLVFKGGLLRSIGIIPLGGNSLTQELSRALNIPFDLAESVKRAHAHVGDFEKIEENKEILVKKDDLYRPIKLRQTSQIATVCAQSICASIKEELGKLVALNEVSNFFVTGRGVLLDGFLEALERELGIPVRFGKISHPDIIASALSHPDLSGQKYLNYLTGLGIVANVISQEEPPFIISHQHVRNPLLRVVSIAKDLYSEYF